MVTKAEKEAAILDRQKDFDKLLKSLNKKFADPDMDEPLIGKLSEMKAVNVKWFSSGSTVLDSILGGGFPVGRVIEMYGPEASGKTSIALNAIADIQRRGGNAVFVDAEQALDTNYATTLGVDMSRLAIMQESEAEKVLDMLIELTSSGMVDIIAVDSIAALSPKAEMEGGMEKQQVGLLARLMSKSLRMLIKTCKQNECTIIFLNQIREKVGVMFGNPETTPGGRAMAFFASQRVHVRKTGQAKDGSEIIGTTVKLKVVKNKVAPPFKEGETVLTFAKGINRPAEMIEMGEPLGVLFKMGNSFCFDPKIKDVNVETGEITEEAVDVELIGDNVVKLEDGIIKMGKSKATAIKALEENPDLLELLNKEVARILMVQREGLDPDLALLEQKKRKKK